MTWVAAAIAGSAVLGYAGARGQQRAAQSATDLQRLQYETAQEQQKPYREAGYSALSKIQEMLPQFTRTFTAQDLNQYLAPNYQFMLEQGLGATRQAANVGGGGSNLNIAATKFAQDYAKNAYQDALNNYRLQQGDIYNRLASIAGIGQTAQQQVTSAGQQAATNIGQLGIGAANVGAGAMQNIGNAGMLYSLLRPQGGFNVSGTPTPGAPMNVPTDMYIG